MIEENTVEHTTEDNTPMWQRRVQAQLALGVPLGVTTEKGRMIGKTAHRRMVEAFDWRRLAPAAVPGQDAENGGERDDARGMNAAPRKCECPPNLRQWARVPGLSHVMNCARCKRVWSK